MSADSSKTVLAVKGWGPIQSVILGYFLYKVPEWIMQGVAPVIIPLLPLAGNVQNFVLFGLFEALVLLCVYGVTRLYKMTWRDLGLAGFRWSFIVLVVGGFFSYIALSTIARFAVDSFVHVQDEVQQVGFSHPSDPEKVLVFLMLALLVPFTEEVLFRGFLFKGVRSGFSFPVTAVVVSLLFALAHGQLDVGIDVFALSLVLCYLREKTGSLWPGILLHGLKNTVAFFFLFIYNMQ